MIDIIVIGASAGGVQALSQLVRDLPSEIPASIFIVLHIPANAPNKIASVIKLIVKGKVDEQIK